MNIDDLKNAWKEEGFFEETPEISIEQKNKIHLPLEKIRKNMRVELWFTIALFIFSFAVITLCEGTFKFKFYISILIASMIFVTFFFFSQFFKLYRNMSNPVLKTLDGLKDLLHQFDLNKQYYLSFCLSFVPFLVCELIIVLEFIPRPIPLSDMKIAAVLIGTLVITMPVLFIFVKWWFSIFYGKYMQQVKQLVKELDQ